MSFDFGENVRGIGVRLDFAHDILYDSIFVDDERGADDAHGNFSVELLLLPDAIGLNRREFGIRQQNERQIVLFGEFHMGFDAVLADADDRYVPFLEFFVVFREADGLSCATGRVVLWIEIDDDFAAFEIRQGDGLPVFVLQREIGRVFSDIHNVFSMFDFPFFQLDDSAIDKIDAIVFESFRGKLPVFLVFEGIPLVEEVFPLHGVAERGERMPFFQRLEKPFVVMLFGKFLHDPVSDV